MFSPCPCGHSRLPRFLCCKKPLLAAAKPRHLLIVRECLPLQQCRELVDYLQSRSGKALGVMDSSNTTDESVAVMQTSDRVTSALDGDGIQEQLDEILVNLCTNIIPRHFSGSVQWYERPKVLSYETGGLYAKHADSEQFDEQNKRWNRVLDRDVSVIAYLNDDFVGGQLDFHFLGYTYTPRAGDVVLFPSDHRYVHEATKVTAGHRLAVVSWVALRGTPRIRPEPPAHARLL